MKPFAHCHQHRPLVIFYIYYKTMQVAHLNAYSSTLTLACLYVLYCPLHNLVVSRRTWEVLHTSFHQVIPFISLKITILIVTDRIILRAKISHVKQCFYQKSSVAEEQRQTFKLWSAGTVYRHQVKVMCHQSINIKNLLQHISEDQPLLQNEELCFLSTY